MGQFYGHTHWDDFKIFFDEDRPINSLYIGSSVTAYTDLNPGYKVFHVDGVESPDRNTTWEIDTLFQKFYT
jgi:sphingomyelin phosphodiesterase